MCKVHSEQWTLNVYSSTFSLPHHSLFRWQIIIFEMLQGRWVSVLYASRKSNFRILQKLKYSNLNVSSQSHLWGGDDYVSCGGVHQPETFQTPLVWKLTNILWSFWSRSHSSHLQSCQQYWRPPGGQRPCAGPNQEPGRTIRFEQPSSFSFYASVFTCCWSGKRAGLTTSTSQR